MISSGSFLQNLTTSSCVFSFLVLSWQCLAQLKSRHIMHCWYWGSDIPSLKFSSLFVVVFLHGWHHGALLVCPWPSSRTLLPQQRNDSRKEKLFARKPIREMLTNVLFPAKLFRDEEKHLGLFDRNILTPVASHASEVIFIAIANIARNARYY